MKGLPVRYRVVIAGEDCKLDVSDNPILSGGTSLIGVGGIVDAITPDINAPTALCPSAFAKDGLGKATSGMWAAGTTVVSVLTDGIEALLSFDIANLLAPVVDDASHRIDAKVVGPLNLRAFAVAATGIFVGFLFFTGRLGLAVGELARVVLALRWGLIMTNVAGFYRTMSDFGREASSAGLSVAGEDNAKRPLDSIREALIWDQWQGQQFRFHPSTRVRRRRVRRAARQPLGHQGGGRRRLPRGGEAGHRVVVGRFFAALAYFALAAFMAWQLVKLALGMALGQAALALSMAFAPIACALAPFKGAARCSAWLVRSPVSWSGWSSLRSCSPSPCWRSSPSSPPLGRRSSALPPRPVRVGHQPAVPHLAAGPRALRPTGAPPPPSSAAWRWAPASAPGPSPRRASSPPSPPAGRPARRQRRTDRAHRHGPAGRPPRSVRRPPRPPRGQDDPGAARGPPRSPRTITAGGPSRARRPPPGQGWRDAEKIGKPPPTAAQPRPSAAPPAEPRRPRRRRRGRAGRRVIPAVALVHGRRKLGRKTERIRAAAVAAGLFVALLAGGIVGVAVYESSDDLAPGQLSAQLDPTDVGLMATLAARLDVPVRALADVLIVDRMTVATVGCSVPWWMLLGVAHIESGAGTHGGAQIADDWVVRPSSAGRRLDGDGVAVIYELGVPDRAQGPFQFISSSWRIFGLDADGDRVADPHNFLDAALGAANHLCRSAGGPGLDLSGEGAARRGTYGYNQSLAYVDDVWQAAVGYRVGGTAFEPVPGDLGAAPSRRHRSGSWSTWAPAGAPPAAGSTPPGRRISRRAGRLPGPGPRRRDRLREPHPRRADRPLRRLSERHRRPRRSAGHVQPRGRAGCRPRPRLGRRARRSGRPPGSA